MMLLNFANWKSEVVPDTFVYEKGQKYKRLKISLRRRSVTGSIKSLHIRLSQINSQGRILKNIRIQGVPKNVPRLKYE